MPKSICLENLAPMCKTCLSVSKKKQKKPRPSYKTPTSVPSKSRKKMEIVLQIEPLFTVFLFIPETWKGKVFAVRLLFSFPRCLVRFMLRGGENMRLASEMRERPL